MKKQRCLSISTVGSLKNGLAAKHLNAFFYKPVALDTLSSHNATLIDAAAAQDMPHDIRKVHMSVNIACWSGPRNLSTAMMYAFGARADCYVVDEPFYAAYLQATGLDHPMRDDILAAGETDPARVADLCKHDAKAPLFYQKHMTHHMLPGFDRSWFSSVKHLFLIRHPARVLASYAAKHENPRLDDIGFAQQWNIFAQIKEAGFNPVVIDSYDLRCDPRAYLTALCSALDIRFDLAMLSWPKGGHSQDGVWAAHWYDAVHQSTGFAKPESDLPTLPEPLQNVCDQALPFYERIRARALTA